MVRKNKSEERLEKISMDFSMNCSPFKVPLKTVKNLNLDPKIFSEYGSQNCEKNLKHLSRFLKIDEENMILSNGSTEIFFLLPSAFKFKKALIIIPSFWEYEHILSLYNVKLRYFKISPKNDFYLDEKDFEKEIPKVDCVYICNPNNPTSTLIDKEILLRLIEKFKNKIFVVDETYLLFLKDYKERSLNHYAARHKNLIVVSSLSKIFSVGGLRLGFCVSSKKNISAIKKYKNPYSMNILAESITKYLLQEKKHLRKTVHFIQKERERVFNELNKIKSIKPFKPDANFILTKIENKRISADKLIKYLKKKNIIVREGEIFKGLSNKYFRISLKTKKENDLLLKNLKNFIVQNSKHD